MGESMKSAWDQGRLKRGLILAILPICSLYGSQKEFLKITSLKTSFLCWVSPMASLCFSDKDPSHVSKACRALRTRPHPPAVSLTLRQSCILTLSHSLPLGLGTCCSLESGSSYTTFCPYSPLHPAHFSQLVLRIPQISAPKWIPQSFLDHSLFPVSHIYSTSAHPTFPFFLILSSFPQISNKWTQK